MLLVLIAVIVMVQADPLPIEFEDFSDLSQGVLVPVLPDDDTDSEVAVIEASSDALREKRHGYRRRFYGGYGYGLPYGYGGFGYPYGFGG